MPELGATEPAGWPEMEPVAVAVLVDQARRLELAEAVALLVAVEVLAVGRPGPAVDQQAPEAERPERAVERPERVAERPERAVERPERAVERPGQEVLGGPVVLEEPEEPEEPVEPVVLDLLLVAPPIPAPTGDAARAGPATPTVRRALMLVPSTELA
jgi:hypothetical protein